MRRRPRSAARSCGNGCSSKRRSTTGAPFTLDLFEQWFDEEVGLLAEVPNIAEAARLMHNMIVADDLVEFLTLPAYELLD